MMPPLADLLARLREATEGSAMLDLLIDLHVRPREWAPSVHKQPTAALAEACFPDELPRYSRSLDAAMTLFDPDASHRVAKILHGFDMPSGRRIFTYEATTELFAAPGERVYSIARRGATEALAACIAALTARQEKPNVE